MKKNYTHLVANELLRRSKLKNVTRIQVAEKMKIGTPSLAKYLSGENNMSLERMRVWCDLIQVAPKEILEAIEAEYKRLKNEKETKPST